MARNVGVDGRLSLGGESKHGVHTKREKIHMAQASPRLLEAGEYWRWGKKLADRGAVNGWAKCQPNCAMMDAEKVQRRWTRLSKSGFLGGPKANQDILSCLLTVWRGATAPEGASPDAHGVGSSRCCDVQA